LQNLKSKIQLDDLKGIQILSPQAEKDLQELAESQISDLNFTQYTRCQPKFHVKKSAYFTKTRFLTSFFVHGEIFTQELIGIIYNLV
jgi:hypothetical protein